jgi:two-component system nitrogen regulation response regulator GlnG
LIVDDEAGMRHSLQRLLQPTGYEVSTARSGAEALALVKEIPFDVAVLDIQMPGLSGLDAYRRLREIDPKLPVVFITAYGTAETAIQAMQMGAYDYILKPFEGDAFREVIDRAAEVGHRSRTRVTIEAPPPVDPSEDRIVGLNPGMQEVYKRIGQVAGADVPVLIRGETGTGKELVARAIVQHSRRSEGPFLAVNCAAIPEGLLESEMFGHERGAFTSAHARRIGKFEQALGGTIFLDEIGDMALSTQAKILRVLQEGTFERLGGNEVLRTDARVIAATHRDLEADCREGRFREDLYYRLNVVTISLPPLRERKDDLPRLVDYFVSRFCAELGVERVSVSSEAMERLLRHAWPGNVRELQNVLKNAILTCRGGVVTAEDVRPSGAPPAARRPPPPAPLDLTRLNALDADLHAAVSGEVERRLLDYALRRCGGNQVQAARLLGVSRSMLRDRMRRYGIESGEAS